MLFFQFNNILYLRYKEVKNIIEFKTFRDNLKFNGKEEKKSTIE